MPNSYSSHWSTFWSASPRAVSVWCGTHWLAQCTSARTELAACCPPAKRKRKRQWGRQHPTSKPSSLLPRQHLRPRPSDPPCVPSPITGPTARSRRHLTLRLLALFRSHRAAASSPSAAWHALAPDSRRRRPSGAGQVHLQRTLQVSRLRYSLTRVWEGARGDLGC